MGRDEVVRISRLVAFGGLTEMDINILLMNYCLEYGKPYYETTVFITILLKQGIFEPFFIEALEYYEKKYTINKLQSKPNNMGQRQIIFIN
ncbi:ABC-type cobalt transporter [Bacteroides phage crAss001]|uniref:ABC-type cobalt transporter n=1 Tax=Bacteroides phage crAss001 TaxID=2301731 RepID=A0A385DTD1_BPCA1|nr:ABC-type cobalt transporter [Bacteroides phage crAss001]AXQ62726.1 ABC-type cobalt transporter [Bacteroides phage crAss001]